MVIKKEDKGRVARLRKDVLARFNKSTLLRLKKKLENGTSAHLIKIEFGVSMTEAQTLVKDLVDPKPSLQEQAAERRQNEIREELSKVLNQPSTSKTTLEKDLERKALREEAQAKNKEDKQRFETTLRSFSISNDKKESFKKHLTKGVSHCMDIYRVPRAQILAEAKRLFPSLDISLLRP